MNRKIGKEYEQILHQENKNGKNYLKKKNITSLMLRKGQITVCGIIFTYRVNEKLKV